MHRQTSYNFETSLAAGSLYMAAQLEVFGFVDHTHSAAELRQDAIIRNGLPNHGRGIEKITAISRLTVSYLSLFCEQFSGLGS